MCKWLFFFLFFSPGVLGVFSLLVVLVLIALIFYLATWMSRWVQQKLLQEMRSSQLYRIPGERQSWACNHILTQEDWELEHPHLLSHAVQWTPVWALLICQHAKKNNLVFLAFLLRGPLPKVSHSHDRFLHDLVFHAVIPDCLQPPAASLFSRALMAPTSIRHPITALWMGYCCQSLTEGKKI